MDGTLTLAVHNFETIREELKIKPGKSIIKTLYSMAPEKAKPLMKKLHEIKVELARNTLPSLGMEDLLEKLQNQGCKMGIVPLNTRENTWITLKSLGIGKYFDDYFVKVLSCSKPGLSPDGMERMLEKWMEVPEDSQVIVDYLYDLQKRRDCRII